MKSVQPVKISPASRKVLFVRRMGICPKLENLWKNRLVKGI